MSDTDSFVQEVTEELRRDRMLKLWKSWGPGVIFAVVAVVAATAVLEWRKQRDEAAAQEAGAALIEALQSSTPEAKALRFSEAAEALPEGPALLARLGEANARIEAGEEDAAAAILRDVAARGGVDPLYRDLADFKAALVELPKLTPSERVAAMTPFTAETHPFRLLALEQRAGAQLAAGDREAARADATAALQDQMASRGLRERLAQLLELIGPEEDA
ncbi:tetratricopeptide repeat protein [Rhodovulum sp. DZ06]|uniref:tetratricopeptide repeat protein n=1 Tax=Rhodovulum sp. DZ06 TaxID=3425126 RepID=UPI003D32A5DF